MAMGAAFESPFLSVADVARMIDRSPDTVLLAIRNKRLKATRLGERKYSIRQTDFENWLRDGARTSAAEGADGNEV